MNLEKPILPYIVNQPWGVYDPATYSQFGFTRHNGIDLKLAPDKRGNSPFNGTVVRVGTPVNGLWQPNGGGIFVGIVSEPMDFPAFTNTTPDGLVVNFAAGNYRILIDLLHCESIVVKEGDSVVAGQQVVICDNTGKSTGPHCHTQWRRINWSGGTNYTTVDTNDANNSFDPTQFFPKDSDSIAILADAATDPKQKGILQWLVSFLKGSGD
jgi:murein DD-endopeptidase MepM/ murein hydrolase activator NlpD